jgi:Zn ribbon nucleic-acid-binding protein
MKQKAPLPTSKILTQQQVQKIYDTLEQMPKTYETEDMKIKPIGLKLFTSGFTWYVVEADKGSEDDEFAGLHPQAFGYVANESCPECSEWGYINIEELIKCNAEMDLYFENKYIKGTTIGTIDELTKLERTPTCPNCGKKKGVELSETVDGFHWFVCTDCGFDFKEIAKEVA